MASVNKRKKKGKKGADKDPKDERPQIRSFFAPPPPRLTPAQHAPAAQDLPMVMESEDFEGAARSEQVDEPGVIHPARMPTVLEEKGLRRPQTKLDPVMQHYVTTSGYKAAGPVVRKAVQKKRDPKPYDEGPEKLNMEEEQLKQVFDVLDLDKNEFVGADELRKILAMIGQNPHDGEIDNMIKMADPSGHGQVSFDNFVAMFTKPADHFSRMSGVIKTIKEPEVEVPEEEQGDDHRAPWETDEMAALRLADRLVTVPKDVKKIILAEFADGKDAIQPSVLRDIYRKLQGMDEEGTGEIPYSDFIKGLEKADSRLMYNIYSMFDRTHKGTANIRDFVVGLSIFSSADTTAKLEFAFQLFDEDGSGSIDRNELIQLLIANFAVTGAVSNVELEARAQIIYKHVSLSEDQPISKRFFLEVVRQNARLIAPVVGK